MSATVRVLVRAESIAARAETTKRTIYAHFDNKEHLFLAVFEFVRKLLLCKLKVPEHYAEDPTEALVLFCGRFQEVLLSGRSVSICRLCIAEAERLPEGSTRIFEAIFGRAQEHIAHLFHERFGLSREDSEPGPKSCWAACIPRLRPGPLRRRKAVEGIFG